MSSMPVQTATTELEPLTPEIRSAIEQQVARFAAALLQDDLHAEAFRTRLQWTLTLGREEIAGAAGLMQGHAAGLNDLPVHQAAHQALAGLRAQLEALTPGADLLQPRKLFGLIPLGRNRLDAYFRRHAQALPRVHALMTQLYAARDGLQQHGIDMESEQDKLREAMLQLAAAAHFARTLDAQLAGQVQALRTGDPRRAKALEQDVLFPVREALQDIQTQQVVCMNGSLALDLLRKTGRELINGCTRVATIGLSALAVAQVVARATGHRTQVMDAVGGVDASLGDLMAQSAQFARNPALGLARIREMLGQTVQAIELMDRDRPEAVQVLQGSSESVGHDHS